MELQWTINARCCVHSHRETLLGSSCTSPGSWKHHPSVQGSLQVPEKRTHAMLPEKHLWYDSINVCTRELITHPNSNISSSWVVNLPIAMHCAIPFVIDMRHWGWTVDLLPILEMIEQGCRGQPVYLNNTIERFAGHSSVDLLCAPAQVSGRCNTCIKHLCSENPIFDSEGHECPACE